MERKFLTFFLLLWCCGAAAQTWPWPISRDTLGIYPYFFYNYWPDRSTAHDGMDCSRRARSCKGDITPENLTGSYANLGFDEYAVSYYTPDTIKVVGVANFRQSALYSLKIYDSTMNLLKEVTGYFHWFLENYMTDSTMHFFQYVDSTNILDGWCNFAIFEDRDTLSLCGKFYIGMLRHPMVNMTASDFPLQLYETHDPPYLFKYQEFLTYHEDTKDWTSDSSRGIPMLLPIIIPNCRGHVENIQYTEGSSGNLLVSWDTSGLSQSPNAWVNPAVDIWIGPSSHSPEDSDTGRLFRTNTNSLYVDSVDLDDYSLYIRKVCNPPYDICGDWQLVHQCHQPPQDSTEIIDPIHKANMMISPNPASDQVTLILDGMGLSEVTITDVAGNRRAAFTAIPDNPLTISTQTFESGTYVINTSDGHCYISKILIISR